ncbi:conserved hypothetical protein [Pyrobaculum islandicum DSM 4184]|uniref:Uncharacterized protein n=1 Tax=Pyrobaculum islandicum (strain DSM 4184 / JCM 9189 / GEO3) TaxID=384616 RepID=A1RUZ5_PYRIL|nr:hypothetical protein [Pyrobaculum islandicum]ABL88777.1 conserved hypothetical protein [Pyrobaculum islandicum DSM 4184]
MDIIAIARGPTRGLYFVVSGPPKCGQLPVKLMELPTDMEPPFRARLVKSRYGAVLTNITKIDFNGFLLENYDQLIEGEVHGNVLEGVVCNKRVRIKILDPTVSGPVLAVIPTIGRRKTLPNVAVTLFAYRLQLV